ncbi:hypothetical protein CQW23_00213 [Capsicum baccatum]|uniref:KIB1-4 beta-propeller domain-containing protein n=1 Tax=Capsicum baccatum TaxID=33114 RepID=A0A2G2XK25_CAPBA|nr:hypothetical protein CQW23_00213 [Capsicum baccatum]
MGNWAELPYDLIVLIAKRFKLLKDFIPFCSVCTSWRIAGTKEVYKVPLEPQVPLLMLADKDDGYREFYSLLDGEVSSIFLPEARKAECYSTKGWLCTMAYTINGEMNLLHPFSRTQIPLPPEKNLWALQGYGPVEERGTSHSVEKAILSASLSVTSDYVLLVAYYAGVHNLAFWRLGDLNWNPVDKKRGAFSISTIMMVDFMGSVIVAKFGFLTFQGLTTVSQLFKHPGTEFYLVEASSALLLVAQFSHGDSSATFKFKVVELDVIKGDFKKIKTMGDSAIFLGSNAVISIDASKFAGVEPNHIYFTLIITTWKVVVEETWELTILKTEKLMDDVWMLSF